MSKQILNIVNDQSVSLWPSLNWPNLSKEYDKTIKACGIGLHLVAATSLLVATAYV